MVNSIRLIPEDLVFPEARFLSEEEQERYEEACKSFNNERAREILRIGQKGSNIFKVLLLNQLGIRTATLPELDLAARLDPNFLKGTYEDAPSVVLRSRGDKEYKTNDQITKDLAEQLKIRRMNDGPLIVNGLGIKENAESPYGLSFEITDQTKYVIAPDFNNKNHEKNFSKINPDYSIEFDEKSNRTLYTRQLGLSRLSLDGDLDLISFWNDLDGSGTGGGVVVIDAGGVAAKNQNDYISQIEKVNQEEILRMEKIKNAAIAQIRRK